MVKAADFSRDEAESFLITEAEMLDELRLDEWNALFTPDGVYWIPIDENMSPDETVSIVFDNALRREERVFHLLHTRFPAQSPRSRTLHTISSIRVHPEDQQRVRILSHQVIYEVRTGDYRQIGLGDTQMIVARVEHMIDLSSGSPKIAKKTISLLNRDMPLGNLTFLI
jgi:3-phenylpropionate/cinnamic acid dioxygenase small subunit